MDGFVYSITFIGHRVHGDVSQVTIYENKLGNTLTSDDVNVTVRTITQGKMFAFGLAYYNAAIQNTPCIQSALVGTVVQMETPLQWPRVYCPCLIRVIS